MPRFEEPRGNQEVKKDISQRSVEMIGVEHEARVEAVKMIAQSLMDRDWKEEESAQPENLKQWTQVDVDGNEMTMIRDNAGHLAHALELRTKQGKLIAQSWDGKGWSVDKYIENGEDFRIDSNFKA